MTLPPDPTMVLALRITDATYDYYLSLPAKTHHDKKTVLGSFIVVPIDGPGAWGWMSKREFHKMYAPVQNWLNTRYTECYAK